MTRTIPHRELRNNSSAVLEAVRRGETIHITNHGEVVATLMPPTDRPLPLDLRPPRASGAFGDLPLWQLEPGKDAAAVLDDLRGER